MIELIRITEHISDLYSYRATQHMERASQLDLLFEITGNRDTYQDWHPLIAKSFKYTPPHRHARFRPAFGKNVFYGSIMEETALYECSFHFIKERIHLKKMQAVPGSRTLFTVEANNLNSAYIKSHPDYSKIMNKKDYTVSHQFVIANPHISFIIYPSCRDPKQRNNAAVLDINHLAKNLTKQWMTSFFYDNRKRHMNWLNYNLSISWEQFN